MHKSEQLSPAGQSATGISQLVLGVVTIIIATLVTGFIVLVLGVILVIRGGLDLYQTSHAEQKSIGRLISGIISLLAGFLLLVFPQIGASVFSLVLATLFIIGGFQKTISPWTQRYPVDRLIVLTGIISFLLGILLFAFWPIRNFEILGILAGIEIMLNGLTITAAQKAFPGLGRESKTSAS